MPFFLNGNPSGLEFSFLVLPFREVLAMSTRDKNTTPAKRDSSNRQAGLPIVGIGASAGDRETLQAFFHSVAKMTIDECMLRENLKAEKDFMDNPASDAIVHNYFMP